MNETLKYIANKFNLDFNQELPIPIYNINRTIMAALLNELGFKEGAEIGVAEGYHAQILCQAIPALRLHAVDIWQKYPGYEEYPNPEDCYRQALENLKPYNVKFYRKFSMDAVKEFPASSLDFVYIDGAHDFKSVAEDICEWSPKVRVGGIVFGHDYKRSSSRSKFKTYVKDVVNAYMYSHGISPWFVLANDSPDPKFGRDNPGWMFVRQEGDEI